MHVYESNKNSLVLELATKANFVLIIVRLVHTSM